MKRDSVYIYHIRDAIKNLESYTRGLTFKKLSDSILIQDAVVRKFEIIGEAAKNVSEKFKSQHSKMPWREMSDMRNKLVHEYFDVDIEVVWKTIQDDLPKLKKQIDKAVKGLK